ncbi:hypothetical protein Vadar_009675 [Vaccinium darrowii]|uniref:Uncharacterized protein n=1 Tax=Vaccinium darrowii TaxID=229202 RepID=A0ACB7Y751_9ERIC|nr:hypothetical protein Vadar_009675 [Vaccinium darrowii]
MTTTTQKILFFAICILPSIFAHHPTKCNRSCGSGQSKPVPFPFGFSSGCPIQLNCTSNGIVSIDQFTVQSFTPDAVMINLPAKCNRPIETLRGLFSRHYAPTSQNGILLENCTRPITTCEIPDTTVQTHFELIECRPKGLFNDPNNNNNMSCYSEEDIETEFIDYLSIMRSGCQTLFSAISIEPLSGNGSPVSLEVEMVQLGWWLEGDCECSANANCTRVLSPVNGQQGYRCRCYDGFVGDGYRAGLGCRKASSRCNPAKYMSGQCGGTTRVGTLVGGIIAGACLMISVALTCCFIRNRSKRNNTKKTNRRLCEATRMTIPIYPYKKMERATDFFSDKQLLGTGAYGTVYAGKLHKDEWVAIKRIKRRDTESIEQVMNEIKLLSLGTPGYLDPQYHQNFQLSDKSDVYSFGVVLVEIITALKVVDFSRPQNEVNLASLAMDRIVKGRLSEIIDPLIEAETDTWTFSSVHKVAELAFRCLSYDRDMRPSMTEVAFVLEQIRLSRWAASVQDQENTTDLSETSNLSQKSLSVTVKKPNLDTRGLLVTEFGDSKMNRMTDLSPVSVQDPCYREFQRERGGATNPAADHHYCRTRTVIASISTNPFPSLKQSINLLRNSITLEASLACRVSDFKALKATSITCGQKRRCDCYDMHNVLVPYSEAWSWQKFIIKERKMLVEINQDLSDSLIVLQHHPVYTLGTGSSEEYLNFNLKDAPYDVYRTERGGEVTYHGPGQLVMYPILNLRYHKMDLHWYFRSLEEVVIRVLFSTFSIKASRIEGMTGVWVGDQKLAAIGIRVSQWLAYHGLALNVTTDLTPFQSIVPCGIQNRGVGSIKRLLREHLSSKESGMHHIEDSKLLDIAHKSLIKEFSEVFQVELHRKAISELEFSKGEPFTLLTGN